ncbi:MAG TPA: PfkB family carbohydrate kinase [Sphingobacteriaceae bacterium]
MFSNYQEAIGRFSGTAVLVVGDIVLDSYLKGTGTRLSPEAPVPVIRIESRTDVAGGAANIAVNLSALGAKVSCLSVIGTDEGGSKAVSILEQHRVDCTGVFRDPHRKTMVKSRLMSQGQILSRFDHGSEDAVTSDTEEFLIRYLFGEYDRFDMILLGDYYRGVITDRVIHALVALQQQGRRFVAVDSKDLTSFRILRPALVKPNYQEACRILNIPTQVSHREAQLQDKGRLLYDRTEGSVIAVTLDADGSIIYQDGEYAYRSFAYPDPAPKVVGAGDTFISALSLALATGADLPVATELATAAAAIAVRKDSTAACNHTELSSFFSSQQKVIEHPVDLKKLCEIYRAQGQKIVFTNGCFDILHSGHISLLKRSKELGDILIVGVNTDESISRLKGSDRPINSLTDRMDVLCGLSTIDHVVPFGSDGADQPLALIRAAQPDIYVKGGAYTRETLPETQVIEESGGQIVFLPLVPEHSTSLIIKRIHSGRTDGVGSHA